MHCVWYTRVDEVHACVVEHAFWYTPSTELADNRSAATDWSRTLRFVDTHSQQQCIILTVVVSSRCHDDSVCVWCVCLSVCLSVQHSDAEIWRDIRRFSSLRHTTISGKYFNIFCCLLLINTLSFISIISLTPRSSWTSKFLLTQTDHATAVCCAYARGQFHSCSS